MQFPRDNCNISFKKVHFIRSNIIHLQSNNRNDV